MGAKAKKALPESIVKRAMLTEEDIEMDNESNELLNP